MEVAVQMSRLRNQDKTETAEYVLIVSGIVPDNFIQIAALTHGIQILDVRALYEFGAGRAEGQQLDKFLFATIRDHVPPQAPPPGPYGTLKPTNRFRFLVHAFNQAGPRKTPGERLCEELNLIPSGQRAFRDYENKCAEILQFLFPSELTAWHTQNRTDSGLNINDLIARITGQSAFWKSLARDFRTLYLLFEFKNYGRTIPPDVVYTTERYLFATALRNVGIIISPKGPRRQTVVAAKGALKESGKLIFFLTNSDLCEMLKIKDSGRDLDFFLYDLLDEFLMTVDRN